MVSLPPQLKPCQLEIVTFKWQRTLRLTIYADTAHEYLTLNLP